MIIYSKGYVLQLKLKCIQADYTYWFLSSIFSLINVYYLSEIEKIWVAIRCYIIVSSSNVVNKVWLEVGISDISNIIIL